MKERILKEELAEAVKFEVDFIRFQYFQNRARKEGVSFEENIETRVPKSIRKPIKKKENIYEELSGED